MINLFKKGFTLIELLIVIAIIGILTAVITTNLVAARARARDTRRKSDLQAIHQSLRLYYTDYQGFPSGGSRRIKGCGATGITVCDWNSYFGNGSNTTYMGNLPLDPSSTTVTTVYYAYYSTNSNSFTLVAKLENASDPDLADSQTKCASALNGYTPVIATTDYIVCAQ